MSSGELVRFFPPRLVEEVSKAPRSWGELFPQDPEKAIEAFCTAWTVRRLLRRYRGMIIDETNQGEVSELCLKSLNLAEVWGRSLYSACSNENGPNEFQDELVGCLAQATEDTQGESEYVHYGTVEFLNSRLPKMLIKQPTAQNEWHVLSGLHRFDILDVGALKEYLQEDEINLMSFLSSGLMGAAIAKVILEGYGIRVDVSLVVVGVDCWTNRVILSTKLKENEIYLLTDDDIEGKSYPAAVEHLTGLLEQHNSTFWHADLRDTPRRFVDNPFMRRRNSGEVDEVTSVSSLS